MSQHRYPGIGRLAYVLLCFVFWFLTCLAMAFILWGSPDLFFSMMTEDWHVGVWLWGWVIATNLILFAVLSMLAILRLRNLGMSAWWFLGRCVPFLNIWVFWRLLVCPEGYADHKQLDLPGKIISTMLFLILALALIGAVLEALAAA